jgi:hypothetical protein
MLTRSHPFMGIVAGVTPVSDYPRQLSGVKQPRLCPAHDISVRTEIVRRARGGKQDRLGLVR